ncbi:MAG TPA: SPW repeat protein [Burkholderiales bacterium]|nr:SPW repeat protein [Burkholderiales bacterium]
MPATAKFHDWAGFTLGLWLAVSPWLLGYSQSEAATANAALLGLFLALGSHFELSFESLSLAWLNTFAGAWLVLSPFVLGFSSVLEAAANAVAVGAAVMVLCGAALSAERGFAKGWQRRAPGR